MELNFISLIIMILIMSNRQLSTEAKLFLQADKSLREVVRVVAEQPTALKAISTPGESTASKMWSYCPILIINYYFYRSTGIIPSVQCAVRTSIQES